MAKFNPLQIGKRRTLLKRMLWVMVGFVCLTLIPWGGQQLDIGATKASASQVAVGVDWGNASFPVENFQEYTSPFGYRGGGFHYGLDLAAPMGSYIRNWWSGQVVELWEDNRCGTGIIIQSGQWEHIYCHVQGHVQSNANGTYFIDRGGGLELRKGQIVPAGTRIARVGMTGRTTGPHLHWGLKYSNRWVDPARVLIAMYNEQNQRLSQR